MWSVKSRLYLLVLIATLPFIVYIFYSSYQNIQAKKNNELTRLSEIASLTAAQHKQITEGARQLLISLSYTLSTPRMSAPDCSKFLTNLLSNYVRYDNFGIVDRNGNIRCAANLDKSQQNPPSKSLLIDTLDSQSFTVGTYYQTVPTGAVINFAYPISQNELVYASLSLDWVSNFINSFSEVDDLVINILDRNGTVLARSPKTPDALGKNFTSDSLVQEILTQGSGQTTKVGIDQVLRLYAFTSLDESHTTFIAVGTPQSKIYSLVQQSLFLSLFTIAGIISISFFLAYRIGQLLILRQIESLQSIDKLKDEFVSLASHQIRSPLTAIRWLSESLLESKISMNPQQRTTLEKIYSTTLRIITLTSNLLNISRIEAGSLVPHFKSISVSELVLPVISEVKAGSARTNIKLQFLSSKQSILTTDPLLVREILLVLISNALKYSFPKKPIIVQVLWSEKRTIIHVENTGIGIPKNAEKNIFTRFYRADNARTLQPDGNGLGLYLARLITVKLGGKLMYKSTLGNTIFTLTLPNVVS